MFDTVTVDVVEATLSVGVYALRSSVWLPFESFLVSSSPSGYSGAFPDVNISIGTQCASPTVRCRRG